jgi:pimeloyl-ACP methyl ester carboxylesterase
MATIVVAHGAWSAGWAWKKMRPLMREAGHELFVPTYTGLGEREHLLSRDVGLDTHIDDVLGVLEYEDLREVMLVGHSYGGMVATGVADRARGRIARLVYYDAFVPRDGQSLMDLQPPGGRERLMERVRAEGEGWLVPSNPIPPDTSPEDVAWITARRLSQPLKCFEQKLKLSGEPAMPRRYIYCRRIGPGDPFRQFLERARSEGWPDFEIDASHSAHVTAPELLRDTLQKAIS